MAVEVNAGWCVPNSGLGQVLGHANSKTMREFCTAVRCPRRVAFPNVDSVSTEMLPKALNNYWGSGHVQGIASI